MSKTKKIALTSVAAVTAGIVTTNSLTFTQAHASSKKPSKSAITDVKRQAQFNRITLSNKQAKQIAKAQGTNQAKQKKLEKSQHSNWAKNIQHGKKIVGRTWTSAYQKDKHSGLSSTNARLDADAAAREKANSLGRKYYGDVGSFINGAQGNYSSNLMNQNFSTKSKHKTTKTTKGTSRSKIQGVNFSTFENGKVKKITISAPASLDKNGKLKHQNKNKTTPKVKKTSNSVNNRNTNRNTPQTSSFNPTTIKADTVNKGTKLSSSIKKLDSTNQKQTKAVDRLFGSNKIVVKNTTGKVGKALSSKSLKTNGTKAIAHAGKEIRINTGIPSIKVAKPKFETITKNNDKAEERKAGVESVSTPAPEASASSSTDATGNTVATTANGKTTLTSDISKLDQQAQDQSAQLSNLLASNSANTADANATGATASADANGTTTNTSTSGPSTGIATNSSQQGTTNADQSNAQGGSTIVDTPAGQNSVTSSAKAMNPLQSLMANKTVATPTAKKVNSKTTKSSNSTTGKASPVTKASMAKKAVQASTVSSASPDSDSNNSTVATKTSSNTHAHAVSATSGMHGASSKGNVVSDVSSSTGAESTVADNGGIKSSPADDGSSTSANISDSNNADQLPQTGNSSSKAGIIEGSALIMTMAGLGLSAKAVKSKS